MIMASLAIVSFCGGAGAWALREWFSWKNVEARSGAMEIWRADTEQELATLTENQCILFRLENVDRARTKTRLVVVPVACRDREQP